MAQAAVTRAVTTGGLQPPTVYWQGSHLAAPIHADHRWALQTDRTAIAVSEKHIHSRATV